MLGYSFTPGKTKFMMCACGVDFKTDYIKQTKKAKELRTYLLVLLLIV